PSGDQGTAQIKTIRIVLQIDNTANFELKIDASIVMATIQSVEEAKVEAINYADNTKVHSLESLEQLTSLEPWDGRAVYVKSVKANK
ncbi:phage tail protein, partial [Acinetobacter baumannii]